MAASLPVFEEQLQYNQVAGIVGISPVAQYNGNIASQSWGTGAAPNANSYVYAYDALNRLTAGTTATGNTENNITYDLMGNITQLYRYQGSAATLIDKLTYTYTNTAGYPTNQLQTLNDASGSSLGAVNGTSTFTGHYDANGNLTADPSKPTGTINIGYNLLNLPQSITGAKTITYTYDADGQKLRRVSAVTGSTDYISGIEYDAGAVTFIQTEEGRAVPSGSTSYIYDYYLADHLGNTRVTFDSHTATASQIQKDDYYPFGMDINSIANTPPNNYLYNKKELQGELAEYDYGARFYDPVIGRWTVVDPSAGSYQSLSPYNYVDNNPIKSIDPDGRNLIVLNATSHVLGFGHAAVLIGNPEKGYDYYSKNGAKSGWPIGASTYVKGGKRHHYNTLKEFENSKDNKDDGPYDRTYEIKTDKNTDDQMKEAAGKAVESDYLVLGASCIDVASTALLKAHLDPGYQWIPSPQTERLHPILPPAPNTRVDFIILNNPGTLIIFPTHKKVPIGKVTSSGGHVGAPTPNDY